MSYDVYLVKPAPERLRLGPQQPGDPIIYGLVARTGQPVGTLRIADPSVANRLRDYLDSIPEGEEETVHDSNYTANMSPMWRDAGIDLTDFDGEDALSLATALEPVLARLSADPDHWRTYDAPNGWGSYERCTAWLREVRAACLQYPDSRVRVSC